MSESFLDINKKYNSISKQFVTTNNIYAIRSNKGSDYSPKTLPPLVHIFDRNLNLEKSETIDFKDFGSSYSYIGACVGKNQLQVLFSEKSKQGVSIYKKTYSNSETFSVTGAKLLYTFVGSSKELNQTHILFQEFDNGYLFRFKERINSYGYKINHTKAPIVVFNNQDEKIQEYDYQNLKEINHSLFVDFLIDNDNHLYFVTVTLNNQSGRNFRIPPWKSPIVTRSFTLKRGRCRLYKIENNKVSVERELNNVTYSYSSLELAFKDESILIGGVTNLESKHSLLISEFSLKDLEEVNVHQTDLSIYDKKIEHRTDYVLSHLTVTENSNVILAFQKTECNAENASDGFAGQYATYPTASQNIMVYRLDSNLKHIWENVIWFNVVSKISNEYPCLTLDSLGGVYLFSPYGSRSKKDYFPSSSLSPQDVLFMQTHMDAKGEMNHTLILRPEDKSGKIGIDGYYYENNLFTVHKSSLKISKNRYLIRIE